MQDLEGERAAKKDLEEQLKAIKEKAEAKPEQAAAADESGTDPGNSEELTAKVVKLEKTIETWKVRSMFLKTTF